MENKQEIALIDQDVIQKFNTSSAEIVAKFKAIAPTCEIVTNEKEAEKALGFLKKADMRFEEIQNKRLDQSRKIDEFKKNLMVWEKQLDKKNVDGLVWPVKNALDTYNAAILKKQLAEKKKIEEEAGLKNELIEYKTLVKEAINNGVLERTTSNSDKIESWFYELKLKNFEANIKGLDSNKPLLVEFYNELIDSVKFDQFKYLKASMKDDIVNLIKKEKPFEPIAEAYLKAMRVLKDSYKEKAKGRKAELENLAKSDVEEKAKIQAKIDSQRKQEAEEKAAFMEKQRAKNEAALAEEKLSASINAGIEQQAKVQSIDTPDNVTSKLIYSIDDSVINDPKKIGALATTLIMNIMISEKFKGILKSDKDGNPVIKNGKKQCIDWLQNLLDTAARYNIDIVCEGLNSDKVISTRIVK